MLTCKGYTLSKHFAYVELLCTLHKSPDLQQSVNTSHFLQIPPAADSLLSTFRAFLPHPMPARRQPRCFARLNTWGQKPKEGREEKKKIWRRSCRGCPMEVTSRRRLPAAPAQPPDPPHLQDRPQLLFGHADHQADLQQARGQRVLHGTAARSGTGRQDATLRRLPSAPPVPSPQAAPGWCRSLRGAPRPPRPSGSSAS